MEAASIPRGGRSVLERSPSARRADPLFRWSLTGLAGLILAALLGAPLGPLNPLPEPAAGPPAAVEPVPAPATEQPATGQQPTTTAPTSEK